MIKRIAQIAMILSLSYYAIGLGTVWIGQILGLHNDIWDLYDFPLQSTSPPIWALYIGLTVSALGLFSLGIAYASVWGVLEAGAAQDFRQLGRRLQKMAAGLIGFWFFYNLLSGGVQYLIIIDLDHTEHFDMEWDPLDLDIILLITGIAILAISQTLERAWKAEDETKHFL